MPAFAAAPSYQTRELFSLVRDATRLLGCPGGDQAQAQKRERVGELPHVTRRPRRLHAASARVDLLPDFQEYPGHARLARERLSQQALILEPFGNHAGLGDPLQTGRVVALPAVARAKHGEHARPLGCGLFWYHTFGPLRHHQRVRPTVLPEQYVVQIPDGPRHGGGVSQRFIRRE